VVAWTKLSKLGVAAALAAALAACGSSLAVAPVSTSAVDLPRSYIFQPASISVAAGTTVTWTNNDNFTHDVEFTTGDRKRLPDMKPGEKSTFTFSQAGSYHYQCHYHPQNMQGDVVVH
jgi:plastocyanin